MKKDNVKSSSKSQYKQQVKTFKKRYGRKGYQQAGSLGGKKSPTRFTSETARRAANIGWEKRRALQSAEGETDENRSTQENKPN